MRSNAWKSEWKRLMKQELQFLKKRKKVQVSLLNEKLDPLVPERLKGVLEKAFIKGFQIIFEKGNIIIDKTYNKKKKEQDFKIRSYAADIKQDRKSLKDIQKGAVVSNYKNLAISAVEGTAFGALGIGVPDIPLFLGVILKSIYEIAVNFGYQYDSEEEKYFILNLIFYSLQKGNQIEEKNAEMNQMIYQYVNQNITVMAAKSEELVQEMIEKTACTLSEELLYLKFLQGIPLVGVVGGLSDITYLKQITDYAFLKYRRRYLLENQ